MTNAPARRNVDTILRYFTLVTAGDFAAAVALLDDDIVKDIPYLALRDTDSGRTLYGKAKVLETLRYAFGGFKYLHFTILDVYDCPAADAVILEMTSEGAFLREGLPLYRNRYVFVVRFNPQGKIVLYREYFDPYLADEARAHFTSAPG